MKDVCVLIVTYNRLNLLKEEIGSIRVQSFKDFDILVVNNGSTDGTTEWLSKQSDIKVIEQQNLGGSGGFFSGMKFIVEKGYKYCWLMDDDVICKTDALEKLMNVVATLPNFGFLCSRVYGTGNNLMNVPIVDERMKNGEYSTWMEKIDLKMIKVIKATFVSVLIPCNNIKQFGLPYKDYFIWGDDYEYTQRLSQHMDSNLVCDSIVIHKRKQQKTLSFVSETNPARIDLFFYFYRNSFNNIKKYEGFRFAFFYIIDELRLLLWFLKNKNFLKVKVMLKALWAQLSFSPKIEFPDNEIML